VGAWTPDTIPHSPDLGARAIKSFQIIMTLWLSVIKGWQASALIGTGARGRINGAANTHSRVAIRIGGREIMQGRCCTSASARRAELLAIPLSLVLHKGNHPRVQVPQNMTGHTTARGCWHRTPQ